MGIVGSMATLGVATGLSYAAARAGSASRLFAWHRYRIVSVPVTGMPAMPRGHSARVLGTADLAGLPIDASAAVQAARFAAGLTCIGAFAGDALVGVNWLTIAAFDEDEVRVRYLLPADAAWDTGLWIPPERRLGRAFAAVWAATAAWLAERGLARSISRIADYNTPSLRAHLRMRATVIASLSVLTVGQSRLAAGARPLLSRRALPVVDLRQR
jgi:hypothetical protein